MGTTLAVTTGFGFAVPPEVVRDFDEPEDGEGFYDPLDDAVREEPLLDYAVATFYDYSPADDGEEAYVVFLRSLTTTKYGAGVFRPRNYNDGRSNAGDFNALSRVADKLGIKNPEFEFLTVVSLG